MLRRSSRRPNVLILRIEQPDSVRPTVRVLVDGSDRDLVATGSSEQNTVADLLGTGELLPVEPPRRVAVHGCDCGELGCGQVAVVIARTGDVVTWSDAMSVTGAYGRALHHDPAVPDPVAELGEDDWLAHPLGLPTYTFDAAQYLAEVRRATEAAS